MSTADDLRETADYLRLIEEDPHAAVAQRAADELDRLHGRIRRLANALDGGDRWDVEVAAVGLIDAAATTEAES